MADNWDDSDDDWDADDDEIDKKLGLVKQQEAPTFDDEEDLALKEKREAEAAKQADLKKKGTALAARKKAEADKEEELELARRAMELEAEAEANMTPDELKAFKRMQIEQADNALTDDLFGGGKAKDAGAPAAVVTGDKLVLKDLPSHLKHARKCANAMRDHGKIYWAKAFIDELIKQSADTLDADALADIVKTCNVLKNDKVQAAKRVAKGQAQKAKAKRDKQKELEAQKKQVELFGDSNQYDEYDQIGEDFEDAFF